MKNIVLLLTFTSLLLSVPFAEAQTQDFFTLVRIGSLSEVRVAIANGANPNARDSEGLTPLMYAAFSNPNPEIIVALLKAGADLSAADTHGMTPLMFAALNNRKPEITAELLRAGADLSARAQRGLTPLMFAAGSNPNPEVVAALLKAGADAKGMDEAGKIAWDYVQKNEAIKNSKAYLDLKQASFGNDQDIYQKAGFPATSRIWFGVDYANASRILSTGKVPLPRYSGPYGTKILDRATSADNLIFLASSSVPPEVRMKECILLVGNLGSIAQLYRDKYALHHEVVHLATFILYACQSAVLLGEELEKKETDPNKLQSLKTFKRLLTGVFSQSMALVSMGPSGDDADLDVDISSYLVAMKKTLPTFKKIFQEDYVVELLNRLTELKQNFKKSEDIGCLDDMIYTLKN